MVLVCLAPESWSVWISTEEHFMAAKKKSVLAQRVNELEDAVTRLFTGEAPAPKPAKRSKAKRKAARRRQGRLVTQSEEGREEGGAQGRSARPSARRAARRPSIS